jgi:acyl-[acyl-carrier-protein]-phospholipid O-acyltransferase/long-chain-fatty-acid--[acyl-carrier-protein] ligase
MFNAASGIGIAPSDRDTTMPDATSPLALLRTRRFGPLFLAQFLGGFAENAYRQAMALLLVFGASGGSPAGVALASGTFVLPFVLLSTFAGRLADLTDKARLARRLRLAGLGLAGLGGAALASGSVPAMFACLFLIGCQSALFGPAKYALLPQHLREGELVTGNALVEAGTFLAILLGGIAGGLVLDVPGGRPAAGAALAAVAGLAWLASLAIPAAPPVESGPVPWGELSPRAVAGRVRDARARRGAWLCILGLSWFWALGGALVSLVPSLVHDVAGGTAALAGVFLGAFSIGIGAGSLLCARQLRGRLTAVPVPFSALATGGLLLLLAAAVGAMPAADRVASVADALSSPACLAVLALLAATAASTAYLAVPLFALLQHDAPPEGRAVAMGVNNLVNAGAMVASAGLVALLGGPLGVPLTGIILVLAVLSLATAVIATRLLSRQVLKAVVRGVLTRVYRVEVTGAENFDLAGPRRIVVANHLSFLDGLVVAAFMPGDPVFAVNTQIAGRWWARPLLSLVDFATVDPTNPFGLKALAREVERGRTLVIYPEGRLTVTGSLMKVYDGPGLVADRTGADIVPVRLDGLQYTPFTRLGDRVSKRLFPRVRMTVLPPRRIEVEESVKGRARRKAVGRQLYDLMS